MSTVPDKPSLDNIEPKWIGVWDTEGVYTFDRTATRDNVFAIDTPPPTVSGSLHMGPPNRTSRAELLRSVL
jgi:valyl-tRNA synthetase